MPKKRKRRGMKSQGNAEPPKINAANREISRAIRTDIIKYNNNNKKKVETIEGKMSIQVIWRKIANSKQQIFQNCKWQDKF